MMMMMMMIIAAATDTVVKTTPSVASLRPCSIDCHCDTRAISRNRQLAATHCTSLETWRCCVWSTVTWTWLNPTII